MRFGQSLVQGLINPGYSEGLFSGAQAMGQRMAGVPTEQEQAEIKRVRLEQQAQQEAALKRSQGLLTGNLLGASDEMLQPSVNAALATGVAPTDVNSMLNQRRTAQEAQADKQEQTDKARQEQIVAEQNKAVLSTIQERLVANNQPALAQLTGKIANIDQLAPELQKVIYNRAGFTEEDTQKALSTEGKLAQDMGFVPGTPEFTEQVRKNAQTIDSGVAPAQLKEVTAAVSARLDPKRSTLINDAVVAVSSGGAGTEAITENAVLNIFESNTRAEAAVRRFSSSSSLGRRLADSVSMWLRGEKTEPTKEDREFLIYAASRQHMAELEQAYRPAALAAGMTGGQVRNIEDFYSYTTATKEWMARFEEKYLTEDKQETNEPVRKRYNPETGQLEVIK